MVIGYLTLRVIWKSSQRGKQHQQHPAMSDEDSEVEITKAPRAKGFPGKVLGPRRVSFKFRVSGFALSSSELRWALGTG